MNHNQSSYSDSNEFITNPSLEAESLAKFMAFTKEMIKNPAMMEEMERRLGQKQANNNSSFIVGLNNSQISQAHPEQAKHTNFSINNEHNGHSEHIKHPQCPENIEPLQHHQQADRIKGADVLSHYLSNPESTIIKNNSVSKTSYHSKQQQQGPLQSPFNNHNHQQYPSHQQKPMKNSNSNSVCTADSNQLSQQTKKVESFDDIPIKSSYVHNMDQDPDSIYHQANDPNAPVSIPKATPASKSFSKKTNIKKPSKNNDENHLDNRNNNTINGTKAQQLDNRYLAQEERPICGIKKEFKQHLMEKCSEQGTPFVVEDQHWKGQDADADGNSEADMGGQENLVKRQFLKRGSRKYLSSARDKKSVSQKSKINNNNSNIGSSRIATTSAMDSRQKTPTKRDASQNRILSKRGGPQGNQGHHNDYNDAVDDHCQVRRSVTPKNQRNQKQQRKAIGKAPPAPPKKPQPMSKSMIGSQQGNSSAARRRQIRNVFDDSSDDQDREEDENPQQEVSSTANRGLNQTNARTKQKQLDKFSREKKFEAVEGVFLTNTQLSQLRERYADEWAPQKSGKLQEEEKFNELRKKYTDLCALVEKQKIQQEELMESQMQKFEIYKQTEMQKIKNERRVMERQLKSSMPSQGQPAKKDKEEVEALKKQLEREKEEQKKKDKNNKILIQKYKKESDELKARVEKLENDLLSANNRSYNGSDMGSFAAIDKRGGFDSRSENQRSQAFEKSSSPLSSQSRDKPLMNKANKFSGKPPKQPNFSQEEVQNGYKKTVPFQKSKNKHSEDQHKGPAQEDGQLPTFKDIDNSGRHEKKKKFQFVESSPAIKKTSASVSSCKNKNVLINSPSQSSEEQIELGDQYSAKGNNFFKQGRKYNTLDDIIKNEEFSIKNVTPQMIERLFRYQNNPAYIHYIQRVSSSNRHVVNSSKSDNDKKITNMYNDRSKEMLFENGVKKQIFDDNYTIIHFKNGDIKQKLADGTIIYYFHQKKVDQLTLCNGLNIYRFENNQIELHYDGGRSVQIRNPDGTIKVMKGLAR